MFCIPFLPDAELNAQVDSASSDATRPSAAAVARAGGRSRLAETVMSRRLVDGDPVRADCAPMARGEDRAGFKIDCACFEDDAMTGLSVVGWTGGGLSKLG